MNRQSNRIKANRKPASTENQDSRGVDKEIKQEPAQSAAPEIETPEVLEARGWKRLTLSFACREDGDPEFTGDMEIMEDTEGGLWLVTHWSGPGYPAPEGSKEERRRITRREARAILAETCIPEAFQGDFMASKLDLETAIMKARALLMLMAEAECVHRNGDFIGDQGNAIQAGINYLALETGEQLAEAFYSRAS